MQCTQILWASQDPQARHPIRPIVSSRGSVTFGVAKALVCRSPHHIHSTEDCVEQAYKVTLLPGECLSSYDVTALFTSVPAEPTLGIIKDLLEKDNTLKERTVSLVKDIILLLEFCLHNTYFSFQDQFQWTAGECGYGVPSKPHSSQPLYGVFWAKSSKYCHP